MSIEDALLYLRENKVFLCYTENGLDLWTCGRPMPQPLRRSIYKHREQLAAMMQSGDVRTCPSRDLHRRYWRYEGGQSYTCEVCTALAV
jgi:hypothetical protein